MRKVYAYPKKNLYVYIIIAAALFMIIQINIINKAKEIDLNDKIEEMQTVSFVKSLFCINNSLEYICMTDNNDLLGTMKGDLGVTHYTFPILSFLVNNNETTIAMVETYPQLTNKEEEIDSVEVFSKEIIDENQLIASANPVGTSSLAQSNNYMVNTGNYSLEQLTNYNFLINNIYNVDPAIVPTIEDFDVEYFLKYDATVDFDGDEPKILIYHTHSQESFVDSVEGETSDTVVGVGDELADILENEYGMSVYHLREEFDIVDGVLDRSKAYELIEVRLKEILEEYPSIEIMIDVHRDGIPDDVRLVTNIEDQSVAKIMFFNGLCKTMKDGVMQPLTTLSNPYVKENMAFSFQMFLKANQLYPSITRKIYVRDLRYNLHLRPKSMLIEVGAQTNTVEEAKNAMAPLAEILYEVTKAN
jgi:stage II sporulation protein P